MRTCATCRLRYVCADENENFCKNNNLRYYERDESVIDATTSVSQNTNESKDITMNDILEKIRNDFSLDEVGDILKTALCTMYTKLRKEKEFYHYDMYCIVSSIGAEDYDTEVLFIDSPTYSEDHRSIYKI